MANYVVVVPGKWLDWSRKERWICCDCSLMHRVEVRIRKGQLQVRMFRDDRSTAAIRRAEGIKVMTKKAKRAKT